MNDEVMEPRLAVDSALSYIFAKSLKQLAKETGLPLAVVRKEVQRLWDRNLLDEKDGFYRCQNSIPWRVSPY